MSRASRSVFQKRSVQPVDVVDEARDGVAFQNACAALCAHPGAQGRVVRELCEAVSQCVRVAEGGEEAVDSVTDHVGNAGDARATADRSAASASIRLTGVPSLADGRRRTSIAR